MNDDVQIAGWAPLSSSLSFTLNTQPRTSFDARGDLNFHLFLALDAPCTTAILTWRLYDAPRSTTRLTGSGYGKESLLIANLAGAAAVGAIFRLGAGRRPVSFTGLASFKSRNPQLRSHSVVGIFQRNLQVITQIGAALGGGTAGASATPAEDIVETEEIAEDVFYPAEAGRTPGLSSAAGNTGMAKVVVTLSLLGVSEYAVSFGSFLEFFFGAGIAWIFVRVKANSQPAIGTLYFYISGGAANFQHLVIISFTHSALLITSRLKFALLKLGKFI
jgi:hypothetical protein